MNFKFVDLGGGFGITYKKNEKKIKLKDYASLVEKFQKNIIVKLSSNQAEQLLEMLLYLLQKFNI